MFVLKGEQFNGNVSYTNGSFFLQNEPVFDISQKCALNEQK